MIDPTPVKIYFSSPEQKANVSSTATQVGLSISRMFLTLFEDKYGASAGATQAIAVTDAMLYRKLFEISNRLQDSTAFSLQEKQELITTVNELRRQLIPVKSPTNL